MTSPEIAALVPAGVVMQMLWAPAAWTGEISVDDTTEKLVAATDPKTTLVVLVRLSHGRRKPRCSWWCWRRSSPHGESWWRTRP